MSIYYRKDNRTAECFADDIKKYHKLEDIWSAVLAEHYLDADNVDSVSVTPFGSDALGRIKTKATNKPDYQYDINYKSGLSRKKLIEIKSHRKIKTCDFYTYKVSSLKGCIEHKGRIFTPDSESFIEIPPKSIKELLVNHEHKQYFSYAPNKMAIRISKNELENYIKNGIIRRYYWCERCIKNINKMYKELFSV